MIHSDATPMVKLSSTKVLVGKPVAPKVAAYSSRGPNSYVPSVLKVSFSSTIWQEEKRDYRFFTHTVYQFFIIKIRISDNNH